MTHTIFHPRFFHPGRIIKHTLSTGQHVACVHQEYDTASLDGNITSSPQSYLNTADHEMQPLMHHSGTGLGQLTVPSTRRFGRLGMTTMVNAIYPCSFSFLNNESTEPTSQKTTCLPKYYRHGPRNEEPRESVYSYSAHTHIVTWSPLLDSLYREGNLSPTSLEAMQEQQQNNISPEPCLTSHA